MEEMTTIWIRKKDRNRLDKLRDKLKVKGISVVIERMLNKIKEHKFEEELR